jgi:5-methylcytosine-specific restriction enzyme subunit McrC
MSARCSDDPALARRSLRAFDALLSTVSLIRFDRRYLPDVRFNRLNEHYRPAVELALLILRSMAVKLAQGQVCSASFLVDMNKVFEDFVVVALREALGLPEPLFPQGAKGKAVRLDEAGRIELKPDLSVWKGGKCLFVGDAKYKTVRTDNADLYQLLAYLVAVDLPAGMLIYAAGEEQPVLHAVRHSNKTLLVESLDLKGNPDQILEQIKRLAGIIRRLLGHSSMEMASASTFV